MADSYVPKLLHPVPFLIFLCFHLQHNMAANDRIVQGQQISISDTIISAERNFELGFFKPGNSSNYFVGIWYKKVSVRTVVWVANRNFPITTTSGVLTLYSDGNLAISNQQVLYLVTNTTSNGNTSAILMDSGNLVLIDMNSVILWQSFDYPTDVFLPGMKLGINNGRIGNSWSLVSWRSSEDPGTGAFSLKVDVDQPSQFLIIRGSQTYWASGFWNGQQFSSVPEMRLNYIFNYSYTSNDNESYFTYSLYNSSIISYLAMDISGQIMQRTWLRSTQVWNLFWSVPRIQCDVYAFCGSYGVCDNSNFVFCQCLRGFEPQSSEDWRNGDRSGGCSRKIPLRCENNTSVNGDEDKFFQMPNVRFPANGQYFVGLNANECNSACLSNCSCSAYAYNGSGGCSIWNGDLFNLKQLSDKDINGGTIYLKLSASELQGNKWKVIKRLLLMIIPVAASSAVFLLLCYIICQRRHKFKRKGNMGSAQNILLFDLGVNTAATNNECSSKRSVSIGKNNDSGLPLFTFVSVSASTDNFSTVNKLGEGGFGPVYKGKLLRGQEIAVKRLSKRSTQGLEELINEMVLIAKLQHRNLVKLLGCCLEKDEKILIYEYMQNKSLDSFIFDPAKRGLLDWGTRVRIIEGIAHGLLYLHQYSRLRIIHRDLKASNILLDADMNPKISDFGMARIFSGNESQANTNRIVGTYGYMPPEYALEGLFSIKSDVYSFGVLLLEIMSGKKNTGFYHSDSLNLLGYAWDLWKGDRALELMDPVLNYESMKHMVLRYINVSLLCVQEIAADRPKISEVISMLANEVSVLPSPKQPAFSTVRGLITSNQPMSTPEVCSINGVTVSVMEAR